MMGSVFLRIWWDMKIFFSIFSSISIDKIIFWQYNIFNVASCYLCIITRK